LQNNSIKYLVFGFIMFIFKAVLVIKRNVMITERIRGITTIGDTHKLPPIMTKISNLINNQMINIWKQCLKY